MTQDIQDMTDSDRVVQMANHMEISEFEVFRRAYNDWFGRDVETTLLEQVFARYLCFGSAPPWVRHYTRMFLIANPETLSTVPRNSGPGSALARLVDSRLGRYLLS